MIYTCYEMVRDCRAGTPQGWRYFIGHYVPVVQRLLAHYAPGGNTPMERVLPAICAELFQSLEPAPERPFVAELRQRVLAKLEAAPAGIELDLATVAAALEPLTVVEKQAAWLETMQYDAPTTAGMLRLSAGTVEAVRRRASELLRGKLDSWRRTLLAENGASLGRAAAGSAGAGCFPARTFLDILDGRSTWLGREELQRHVSGCWHCIDHFCRLVEVVELLRDIRPLAREEAQVWERLLDVEEARTPLWKLWRQ